MFVPSCGDPQEYSEACGCAAGWGSPCVGFCHMSPVQSLFLLSPPECCLPLGPGKPWLWSVVSLLATLGCPPPATPNSGHVHLCCSAAWIDKCRPNLLITESTYATTIRDSKRCRERDFLKKVHEAVERGGKVAGAGQVPGRSLGHVPTLTILHSPLATSGLSGDECQAFWAWRGGRLAQH